MCVHHYKSGGVTKLNLFVKKIDFVLSGLNIYKVQLFGILCMYLKMLLPHVEL